VYSVLISRRAAALALGLLFALPREARADAAACVQAHAAGQREVLAGRLLQASKVFAACASTRDCPDPVREECVEFHASVERNIPTVIFSVSGEDGRDITNVRVHSADQLLADSLTGRAIAIDPGNHHFKFVLPSGETLESEILVREGEKNRIVTAPLRARASARSARRTESASARETSGAREDRSLPAGFWVATGFGAAALLSAGVFGWLGHRQESKIDDCSPSCGASRRDDFDEMRRDYFVADISLGVAAVSAGVATWLFVSNERARSNQDGRGRRREVARVRVLPSVSAPGASFVLTTDAL
jgi:hypothetical protein